jgi:hypothetical protein
MQPPLLHFINNKLRGYPTTETIHLPELPFFHFLHRVDLPPNVDSQVAAGASCSSCSLAAPRLSTSQADHYAAPQCCTEHLSALYDKIMREMNSVAYPAPVDVTTHGPSTLPIAYNLLLTSSFLFVIPRKTQGFEGIEVNSIGFIGSFFVRDDAQRALLLAKGPMELLRQVTFPPHMSSL